MSIACQQFGENRNGDSFFPQIADKLWTLFDYLVFSLIITSYFVENTK